MIHHLLAHVSYRASHAAGSAAIGLGACIALCVGLAFWTAAGWIYLTTQTTALNAAIIMGAVYSGAGLIGFSVIGIRRRALLRRRAARPVDPVAVGVEGIIGAFVTGMTAGSQARSSRR